MGSFSSFVRMDIVWNLIDFNDLTLSKFGDTSSFSLALQYHSSPMTRKQQFQDLTEASGKGSTLRAILKFLVKFALNPCF